MNGERLESIKVSQEKFDRWVKNINTNKGGYSYIYHIFHDEETTYNPGSHHTTNMPIYKRKVYLAYLPNKCPYALWCNGVKKNTYHILIKDREEEEFECENCDIKTTKIYTRTYGCMDMSFCEKCYNKEEYCSLCEGIIDGDDADINCNCGNED
jgi:hypothetical protein